MHQFSTLDIGLDVHKESIAVADIAKGPGPLAPPRTSGATSNCGWQRTPQASGTSAGKPRGRRVNAPDA
jgi:hypothetical protein